MRYPFYNKNLVQTAYLHQSPIPHTQQRGCFFQHQCLLHC
ncbi:hypothetical protein OKW43_008178 [Paraburkholderia sp. WC7.3g]